MSTSDRRYHHGDLRPALIEEGLRLIAEGPADVLSLRELARRVGVSATAVYRHFPDKGALMAALAAQGLMLLGAAQPLAAGSTVLRQQARRMSASRSLIPPCSASPFSTPPHPT